MNNKKGSRFYTFLLMTLILFLAITSLFVMKNPGTSFIAKMIGNKVLSCILSFAALAFIAMFLNYVNSSCFLFGSDSYLLWGSYLTLVFILPGIPYFTEYHIGAFLILLALLFIIKYMSNEKFKPSQLFFSMLLVSSAAAIIPPLFSLTAVFIILALFGSNGNIFKSILTMLAAISLPMIYLFCSNYIFNTISLPDYLGWYRDKLSLNGIIFSKYRVIFIVYEAVVILLFIRSVISVIITHHAKNRTQKISSILFLTTSFVLAVIYVLYHNLVSILLGIILFIPLSFVIYDFYHNAGKKERRIVLTIFIILSAALRIYEMINI